MDIWFLVPAVKLWVAAILGLLWLFDTKMWKSFIKIEWLVVCCVAILSYSVGISIIPAIIMQSKEYFLVTTKIIAIFDSMFVLALFLSVSCNGLVKLKKYIVKKKRGAL